MYSKYITPDKQYLLKVDKFICNKFGLAEFFAKHYDCFGNMQGITVLDVGCGASPLGIFLSDQHKCKVTGVELNPIACSCARDNIKMAVFSPNNARQRRSDPRAAPGGQDSFLPDY